MPTPTSLHIDSPSSDDILQPSSKKKTLGTILGRSFIKINRRDIFWFSASTISAVLNPYVFCAAALVGSGIALYENRVHHLRITKFEVKLIILLIALQTLVIKTIPLASPISPLRVIASGVSASLFGLSISGVLIAYARRVFFELNTP